MNRSLLAAALALTLGAAFAQGADGYERAVTNLVTELTKDLPWQAVEKQPAVGVGWFVLNETKFTGQFGNLLSNDIRGALVQQKKLKVVTLDLKELDDIKNSLWIHDAVDPTMVPKAPKGFTAFTLLVRGRYYADIRKDTVQLRAELVDVATGEPRSASSASILRAEAPVPLEANELGKATSLTKCLTQVTAAATEPVPKAPEPDRKVRVRVWAEGMRKVLSQGEKAFFKVAADQDAYVYLFNITPDGATKMLFPNAYHADNFLPSGKVLTIPSDDMKFELEVNPPFGDEAVQAVATTSRPVSDYIATRGFDAPKTIDNPFKIIEGGAKSLATVIRDVRTRGLEVIPKGQNEPVPAWAEDYWSFTTAEKAK